MTDSAQLVPSKRHTDLTLAEIPHTNAARVGSLYRKVWEPLGGGGRSRWTDAQWVDELNQSGISAWVAQIEVQLFPAKARTAATGVLIGTACAGLIPL